MKLSARLLAAGLLFALPNLAPSNALLAQETTEAPARDDEPVWPFETSDIEVDPAYVFGQLDNGMRYILRENKTPEGTALVRMRIDSGSLDETDEDTACRTFLNTWPSTDRPTSPKAK